MAFKPAQHVEFTVFIYDSFRDSCPVNGTVALRIPKNRLTS